MVSVPLNLGLGSNVGRDSQVSSIRHINCYTEDAGSDAKNKIVLYVAPGFDRFDNGSYTGATRGLIQLNDNSLIAILGNEVVSFDTGGISSTLGTLVGSGRVFLARNRNAAPQIAILTNSGLYHILQNGTVSQIIDADLPTSNSVCYLKGFFLFSISDGRIYQSDLDASNVGALAFDSANSRSEGLVRVFPHAGFLYAFGRRTTEIWQADASLASEPFVFSPIQQDIDLGCIAPHSVAQIGVGLGWVDDNGIVRYGRDGGAQRISTHSIERDIEDLTQAQRMDIAGKQWFHQGHEFYTLFSDLWTRTYDLNTGQWHERNSYDSVNWVLNDIIPFDGKFIAGNKTNGRQYVLGADFYDEDGDLLVLEIQAPSMNRFPSKSIADAIEVDAIMGVGVTENASGVEFNDGAYIGFGDVLDLSGSFTLEAIVNPRDITQPGQRIIAKDNGTIGWGFSLGDNGQGGLRFFHRSLNTVITDATGVVNDIDQHVAVVHDSVADTVRIYVNGVQTGQTTGQTNALASNSNILSVGAGPNDPAGNLNFDGFIREVRIWNVARSQAQIDANKFLPLTGSETGLVGYWPMTEQTGGIINDLSPSNFDGMLSNGATWSSVFFEHIVNPKLMIDYSDDGGKNFTGERQLSLGRIGQYTNRIRSNKWGLIRETGRIWRFRASAAVLRGIISASVDLRAAR